MTTTPQRGKKRQADDGEKQPKRTRRRLRGSLQSLPNMPIDILIEIMIYLTSSDLLHLARTTKIFRAFLMNRSAKQIWRAARVNVPGLPDCPKHLSEPGYAHLAFDTFCFECLKPNVKIVFWALGVRYCPSCRSKLLVRCNYIQGCGLITDSIVPHSRERNSNWHLHLRGAWYGHRTQEYYAKNRDEKARHAEDVRSILSWAVECETWCSNIASSRETEIIECRSRRLHAIIAKLSELGWADELARIAPEYTGLTELSCVREARDLTDRAWQNIKNKVVGHMQLVKSQRLECERRAVLPVRCEIFVKVYMNWHRTQADKTALPRPVDLIFRRSELRELIAQDHDVTVTEQDFEALVDQFAVWAAEWAEDCTKQLRDIVLNAPEFKDRIPEGVDPLSLASVAFTCQRCSLLGSPFYNDRRTVPAPYPEILQHDCLWVQQLQPDDEVLSAAVAASISLRRWRGVDMHGPWSCKQLSIRHWHRRMAEVITFCGEDPMTVTRERMDALDPWLYCEVCEEKAPGKDRQALPWWNTLAHCNHHHYIDERFIERMQERPPIWRMITDPGELKAARMLGAEAQMEIGDPLNPKTDRKAEGYHCYRCSSGLLTCRGILEHLRNCHNLESHDITPSDYYLAPGTLFSFEQPVVLRNSRLDALQADSDGLEPKPVGDDI